MNDSYRSNVCSDFYDEMALERHTFNDLLLCVNRGSFFYYIGILHVYLALTIGFRAMSLTTSVIKPDRFFASYKNITVFF